MRKTIALFLVIAISISSFGSAYNPSNGDVEVQIYVDTVDRSEIIVGSVIKVDIVIKNLTNDTASNLTATQQIPEDAKLTSIFGQSNPSIPSYQEDLSRTNTLTNEPISLRYLNITSGNFTTNIDITLAPGDNLGLQFSLNLTAESAYPLQPPTVTYYDHWGDQYNAQQGEDLSLEALPAPVDTRLSYIPDFETTDTNYHYIIGGFLSLLIIALFGRMLYFNKPFEQ